MRFASALLNTCLVLALSGLLSACGTTAAPAGPAPAGYYRVKPGDTLFRIAQNHGQTVNSLADWNQLRDTHSIEAGQLLRVVPPVNAGPASASRPASPAPAKRAARPATAAAPAASRPALVWPVKGEVISRFNGSSSKGIDIAGREGEPVVAAAAGKIVYAGAGIDAYGKLLIIKHNNDFLTAYAHNQNLLVKEGTQVKQGQRIATLGRSGTNRFKLQFQVRYKGKAVDPVAYLP